MAMPASGCISLRTCITGCACSSISCAVAGVECSPASLSGLSEQIGRSTPHCMSEFYGFEWKAINLCRLYSSGTDGTSNLVIKCHCLYSTPALVSGEAYLLSVVANLCNSGQAAGSLNFICVTCNGVCKQLCCSIVNPTICATPSTSFAVDDNDAVIIYTCACTVNTACGGSSGTWVCINATVSVGPICKGTTCVCNCTWTG